MVKCGTARTPLANLAMLQTVSNAKNQALVTNACQTLCFKMDNAFAQVIRMALFVPFVQMGNMLSIMFVILASKIVRLVLLQMAIAWHVLIQLSPCKMEIVYARVLITNCLQTQMSVCHSSIADSGNSTLEIMSVKIVQLTVAGVTLWRGYAQLVNTTLLSFWRRKLQIYWDWIPDSTTPQNQVSVAAHQIPTSHTKAPVTDSKNAIQQKPLMRRLTLTPWKLRSVFHAQTIARNAKTSQANASSVNMKVSIRLF